MAELESDGTKTRGGVADFLREFADELEGTAGGRSAGTDPARTTGTSAGTSADSQSTEHDGTTTTGDAEDGTNANRITLIIGGDSATVLVPDEVDFDVEVDSRSPMLGTGVRQEIDFTLAWDVEHPDETTDDLIQIE